MRTQPVTRETGSKESFTDMANINGVMGHITREGIFTASRAEKAPITTSQERSIGDNGRMANKKARALFTPTTKKS